MPPTVLPPPVIFPTVQERWVPVDLEAFARRDFLLTSGPNPLNEPGFCQKWIDDVHRRIGGLGFGGYCEDRARLWRGHYMAPGMTRHLGTDYNAPAGTPVVVPVDCEVLRVVRSRDQDGGWGGMVFFSLERPYRDARYFLYGHLSHEGLPFPGAKLKAGDNAGIVGAIGQNGGWFAHLHVQCFNDALRAEFGPELENMDGYGPVSRFMFPDRPDPTWLCAGME